MVFISSFPFFNVTPKVREQRVWVGEAVWLFLSQHMTVVAFARFIVVAQDADPIHNECEPIFESVH
jgi:hypothetical protein